MAPIEVFKSNAEYGSDEFLKSLEGVTERQAWAVLPHNGPDYLHTDGSIYGIALHVATCKRAYASICFRDTELRWRDLADEVEKFEFSWDAVLGYVKAAQKYWMDSWSGLTNEALDEMRPTNWGKPLPAWRILQVVHQHDSYHAGQIAMLKYGCGESDKTPESVAEDIRKYCVDSEHW